MNRNILFYLLRFKSSRNKSKWKIRLDLYKSDRNAIRLDLFRLLTDIPPPHTHTHRQNYIGQHYLNNSMLKSPIQLQEFYVETWESAFNTGVENIIPLLYRAGCNNLTLFEMLGLLFCLAFGCGHHHHHIGGFETNRLVSGSLKNLYA